MIIQNNHLEEYNITFIEIKDFIKDLKENTECQLCDLLTPRWAFYDVTLNPTVSFLFEKKKHIATRFLRCLQNSTSLEKKKEYKNEKTNKLVNGDWLIWIHKKEKKPSRQNPVFDLSGFRIFSISTNHSTKSIHLFWV